MAPTFDDWDQWGKGSVEVACTQLTGLPAKDSFTLPQLREPLQNADDFDEWLERITTKLTGVRLEKLIDSGIPRPSVGDPRGEEWAETSIQVAAWLANNMAVQFVSTIRSSGTPVRFADSFMKVVKDSLRGAGSVAIQRALHNVCRPVRSDFGSPEMYIKAMQRGMARCSEANVPIHPYIVASLMISQMRQELQSVISRKSDEFDSKKDIWAEFELKDFNDLCNVSLKELAGMRVEGDVNLAKSNNPTTMRAYPTRIRTKIATEQTRKGFHRKQRAQQIGNVKWTMLRTSKMSRVAAFIANEEAMAHDDAGIFTLNNDLLIGSPAMMSGLATSLLSPLLNNPRRRMRTLNRKNSLRMRCTTTEWLSK
ncbi:hypothetical protein NUU61_001386 [Penicillium alfredii]|uniref:Uncharacterized protein n=1 Tax=Penicillium alfredii TaxID=1506179 RepID=A0A9W9G4C2_9EURO|nr:uncharacterized protein NUU61_001386 [Penicillium alfredii]KAJ5111756.1 hypothetical protein NUU61_001386 [Penicillium alfredii]